MGQGDSPDGDARIAGARARSLLPTFCKCAVVEWEALGDGCCANEAGGYPLRASKARPSLTVSLESPGRYAHPAMQSIPPDACRSACAAEAKCYAYEVVEGGGPRQCSMFLAPMPRAGLDGWRLQARQSIWEAGIGVSACAVHACMVVDATLHCRRRSYLALARVHCISHSHAFSAQQPLCIAARTDVGCSFSCTLLRCTHCTLHAACRGHGSPPTWSPRLSNAPSRLARRVWLSASASPTLGGARRWRSCGNSCRWTLRLARNRRESAHAACNVQQCEWLAASDG